MPHDGVATLPKLMILLSQPPNLAVRAAQSCAIYC